jgi:hypothetical protein
MKNISLIIQELKFVGLYPNVVYFMACGKSIVDHFSGRYTFQFCADKGWPLSRFYVKEFNDFVNVVVIADAKSFSDI